MMGARAASSSPAVDSLTVATRVVFFGSIPVARECLELLHGREDLEVVGVCAVPLEGWRQDQSVWDWCKTIGLALIEHEDIAQLRPDLGLSVRYHRILDDSVLRLFPLGVVNVHGGLLPEYRGSYCNVHAIINDEREYGITLHYLDPGVDTGDVVDTSSVMVGPDDTGMTLYLAGESLTVDLVRRNLPELLRGTANRTPQSELIAAGATPRTYRRGDAEALREITVAEISTPRALRIVRAFDSPHHEPAFTVMDGRKVYLRLNAVPERR